jgi:outer membrane protein
MLRTMTLWALALALLGFSAPMPAFAQAQPKRAPSATIAVVDMLAVERNSRVGKDIARQLQEYGRGLQNEMQRLQDQLRKDEDELKRQQAVLTPDAFAAKRKQFEDRLADAQRQMQTRQQGLQKVAQTASLQVRQELGRIFEMLSKENGFSLLLDRTTVAFAAESLDITRTVVQRLVQSMPSLQVQAPGTQ